MNCKTVNSPCAANKALANWPPVTPFPSASHMRSLHFEAFTHDRFGPFVSAPCLSPTGTDGALPCSRRGAHASTFLSPFPQSGFASRSFSELPRNGTMKTLTPTPLTCGAGLPAYLTTPSCRSVSNHVALPGHRYRHASVTREFRTSPRMSRLVAAPRRIEFVLLRTDNSPPVALHPASRRRSYLRLRSLWLPPTRTSTVLMWRLHGRTHSRARGNPGFSFPFHKTRARRCFCRLSSVLEVYSKSSTQSLFAVQLFR